jgi:segregation and condensation protein B
VTLPLPLAPSDTPAPEAVALPALIESLLFVSPSPVPVSRLAQTIGVTTEDIESALAELAAAMHDGQRGLRLQRKADRVTLTTAPQHAMVIEKLLGLDSTARLSPAAMETLAVIAYRQPLTRPQIESVRGVNCDGVLRTLLARELVEPVGRLEQPGRPFIYGTTFQFLQYFGLDSLAELPPLPEAAA